MKKYAFAVLGIIIGVLIGVVSAGVIWRDGFDTGADVNGCIISTVMKYGDLAHGLNMQQPYCQRAKAKEHSPYWLLRRRNGGE